MPQQRFLEAQVFYLAKGYMPLSIVEHGFVNWSCANVFVRVAGSAIPTPRDGPIHLNPVPSPS